jgi:hypothetical protein
MPSSLAYELDRALSAVQSLMTDNEGGTSTSPTFTWKGQDYACTPSRSAKGKLFGAGGFTIDNNLVLSVQASILPDPGPQPDQFLTYLGDKYRIDLVTTQQGLVILTCNDPNRGAGIVEREM